MPSPQHRPLVVWGAGVLAYVAAVLQRTTLGVSGLEAADHFSASASIVASFVVLQLLVYSLAQIPAGLLLDRFGARVTLTSGAVLMALGQLLIAHTDLVAVAMLARVVVGCGDALTFSSAVRLVPAWFPPSRTPLLTQLTGIIGQLGQVLSAVPFVAILVTDGWRAAFTAAALFGLGIAVVVALVVRPAPPGVEREAARPSLRRIPADILEILRHPATQLGFWTHYTSGFPAMVFAMMWGYPYLTAAEGLGRGTAATLMTMFVLASIAAGPLIGAMTQRHPLRRSTLVLLIVATSVLPLALLLAWPGPAPLWLLVVWILCLSIGGPGSSVGLDFPRTDLPGHRLGTATGIVIMGGFLGALACILLIGVILDALRPDGAYGIDDFRLALSVQLPFLAAGVIGMILTRRALRRRMAERGYTVPPWREVVRSGRITRL